MVGGDFFGILNIAVHDFFLSFLFRLCIRNKKGEKGKASAKKITISQNFGFQGTHTTTFGLMENMGTICEWYKAVSFDQVKE